MKSTQNKHVLIQGGGDLASGIGAVLHRNGWKVVVSEIAEPLVVRRKVAFAEAVWEGQVLVEEIWSALTKNDNEIEAILNEGKVAVVVDPDASIVNRFEFSAIVDARMLKRYLPKNPDWTAPLIGVGPGFVAPENCLAVIETNRGSNMGKIIRQGSAEPDTGIPGIVEGRGLERVLYTPVAGIVHNHVEIGDIVNEGQLLADVDGTPVNAPFDGLIRGLLREGILVKAQTKLGDIDPRLDVELAYQISDKALSVGQSVLEVLESLA